MRFFLILLITVTVTNGQDTLIVDDIASYLGEFIEQTESTVIFKPAGAFSAQEINLDRVTHLGLESQQIPAEASTDEGVFLPGIPLGSESKVQPVIALNRFRRGTFSAGSLFGFSSTKSSAEDDDPFNMTRVGSVSLDDWGLKIKPSFSYFLVDNVSLDGLAQMLTFSSGDYSQTMSQYGLAASYYMAPIYMGAGYVRSRHTSDDYDDKVEAGFAYLQGGALFGLSDNVYLDLNLNYYRGVGDRVYSSDDYEETVPNEMSSFNVDLGIRAFFNLP